MPRITHFDIPADNPDRALGFYKTVFGWESQKWDGPMDYWMLTTGSADQPGIDGGLMQRPHPQATTVNTIEVDSVDEYLTKVEAGGGQMVDGKKAIPGVGYLAYCTDTEGNTFGLFQQDESAQ